MILGIDNKFVIPTYICVKSRGLYSDKF